MNERQDFLQKFAHGVIKANKRMLEQESEEKTRGYEPSQEIPDLHELHEQALLEARREKADSFEIEAIENEMYLKEMKQNIPYNKERENKEQEREEGTTISNNTHRHEPKEKLEEEFDEKEEYMQIHEPETQNEVKARWEEGYHEPQTWDLEGEAEENEAYQKAHPPEEERAFYKSPIEPPLTRLTDYDKPRLYTKEPEMEQSKKSFQLTQIESPPVAPLSRFVHQESTAYPSPMLQKAQTRGFIKPVSQEEILDTRAGLLKMKELIKDHAVTYISCPGPFKPVSIKRMGIPEMLKIALDEAGVRQVIKEFSEASRIPYTGDEGIFKAVVGDLMITAVITETVGSRFTILRVIQ